MNWCAHKSLRHAVLAFITLALLSVPFAHRAGATPVPPDMIEYLALGGALEDICGDDIPLSAGGCESCRIVASVMLPAPVASLVPTTLSRLVRAHIFVKKLSHLPSLDRTPPVRGPPRL
jgi:hypothetical protein